MEKKRIFIITGEHSGDMHGARVANALKNLNPDVEIEAIGGNALEAEGVKLFSNHDKMEAVGLSPKIVFDHITLGKRVVDYLKNEFKPDIVLLIDYGVFNLNIAKFLHKAGIKTYYYIPPQVWASRKWRLKTIKKFVDKVLCIFPFEKNMYKDAGINVTYVGHPLVSQLSTKADKTEFFARHKLDPRKKLVAVFPGSRKFELNQLMHIFVKSARKLAENHPDIQIVFSHAPNLSDDIWSKYFKRGEFQVIKGENQALLSVADSLILASGTVALEAALYQTPMLIAYRGPWFFYLVYLLVRCIKRVSLPNIIVDKEIVKELIQGKLTVKNIVQETEKLLYDNNYRSAFINELSTVKSHLSDKNSSLEVAKEIYIY